MNVMKTIRFAASLLLLSGSSSCLDIEDNRDPFEREEIDDGKTDGGSNAHPDGGSGPGPQLSGLLADLTQGAVGSSPLAFARVGDKVFFVAYTTSRGATRDRELWVTDGTSSGTKSIPGPKPQVGNASEMAELGGKLIFPGWVNETNSSQNLWVSDGTEAGTKVLANVRGARAFIRVGTQLFFHGDDGAHGNELWVTDGTEAGTRMVRDIKQGASGSSTAERVAVWGSKLFFFATDSQGRHLYVTDGTESGTVRLTPGTNYSNPLFDLIVFKERLFFSFQANSLGGDHELWVTDGTPAGTKLFKNILDDTTMTRSGSPQSFNVIGDRLVFFAASSMEDNDLRLWSTDGTPEGTVEIASVEGSFGSIYEHITWRNRPLPVVNGRLVFNGQPPTASYGTPYSLWSTDGTSAGTSKLADVEAYGPGYFTSLGEKLVFLGKASDYLSLDYEPWVTDGTAAGTRLIKDLRPGTEGSIRVNSGSLVTLAGKAYFPAAVSKTDILLFESDGTSEGTRVVAPADATRTENTVGEVRWSGPGDSYAYGHLLVFDDALLLPANFHDVGNEPYLLKP